MSRIGVGWSRGRICWSVLRTDGGGLAESLLSSLRERTDTNSWRLAVLVTPSRALALERPRAKDAGLVTAIERHRWRSGVFSRRHCVCNWALRTENDSTDSLVTARGNIQLVTKCSLSHWCRRSQGSVSVPADHCCQTSCWKTPPAQWTALRLHCDCTPLYMNITSSHSVLLSTESL